MKKYILNILLFWFKNHISCDIICHAASPYIESFTFRVSFKSHHPTGHNLPLVILKVFTASSHNVLYSTPQQIPALPFLSLFPLFYLSCSSSNWRAYQRDVWQGIAALQRLFPVVLCNTIVLGERKREQETMKQMKNTAVCLSPKQKINPDCILLRTHFTEGH